MLNFQDGPVGFLANSEKLNGFPDFCVHKLAFQNEAIHYNNKRKKVNAVTTTAKKMLMPG
jgi:hypothetical protein